MFVRTALILGLSWLASCSSPQQHAVPPAPAPLAKEFERAAHKADPLAQVAPHGTQAESYATIGDTLTISVPCNKDELTLSKKIDIDGTILLPELGSVAVAGYTRTELEALLMEKYSPYYPQLDIKVDIANTGGSKKYFIYGELASPGEKSCVGDETIFEVVMKAGPSKDTANLGRVRLIRADPRDPAV